MGKAARLFNGTAEQTLYGRVTPTPEQRQFLQDQWNAMAEHLKGVLAARGYPISTWLQGSYKYGTLIKPVHHGEEYDVDVGIYFSWDPQKTDVYPTADQLRAWVQKALIEYQEDVPELEEVVEPAKERCSRAIYQQQFHIDTPTYHLDPATDVRRLACLSGAWENSDPKLLYTWFCNDPVKFCSCNNPRGAQHEYGYGRRSETLDSPPQVGPGAGNHSGQDDRRRGESRLRPVTG